jgi:hypothetical protein
MAPAQRSCAGFRKFSGGKLCIAPAPVHEDSKFRTVDLERTELGTLRTCARVPRARARAARAKKNPSALHSYIVDPKILY